MKNDFTGEAGQKVFSFEELKEYLEKETELNNHLKNENENLVKELLDFVSLLNKKKKEYRALSDRERFMHKVSSFVK